MGNEEFNIKCICDWSKNDKYGFIPHADCKAHGYKVKKLLKNSVEFKEKKNES